MGPVADPHRLEATRLGSYEILRKIAKGGMAELFLAQTRGPEGFEKLVVLKKILPNYAENPKFVRLFLDEAKLAATLDHPHIAHVYDMGTVDGNYFFTMEYIHGQDVRSTLRRTSRMGQKIPIDHGVQIARNIAAALHYAHERRRADGALLDIVHRDVSPSNILISYDGAVKLVDFGVAKAATSTERTRTGTLKGKISYMSPEQAKGAQIDRRSDIFALGICLWEMVAMQRLFKAENDLATIQMIINSKAQPPSTLRPECTPELERIILRALSTEVSDRYQTAEELQLDLEELAREQKLKQSPVALRSFMHQMFDAEIQLWNEAQASGLTLMDHVIGNTTVTAPISHSESELEFEPDPDEEDEEDDDLQNAPTLDPPTLQRDAVVPRATASEAMTAQVPIVAPPQPQMAPQFPVAPPQWLPPPPPPVPTATDALEHHKKRIAIIAAIAFAGIVIVGLAFGGGGDKSAAKIEPPPPAAEPEPPAPVAAPEPAPAPAPAAPPAAAPEPEAAPPPPAACNAEALDAEARNDEANGQHAAALVAMEQAIACAPTDRRYALAFMTACNAGDVPKAKLYYQKIPAPNRNSLKQICVRNGIILDPKPAAPDKPDKKDKPKKPIDLDSPTPP